MNKQMIISVILFLLIVGGMFGYVYYKQAQLTNQAEPTQEEPDPSVLGTKFDYIERIDVKHFYIDGVHTYVGELAMPTPCDLLNVSNAVQESYPETIVINFDVINNSETCIQVVTNQRFRTDAPASAEASVVAYFEGRQIELNIVPAAPGETPDEFELFIKG